MILLRPRPIASLATNVTEVAPAAWNGAVTYAEGVRVGVVSGTTVSVFKSLNSGNLNNNPLSSSGWWSLDGTTYLTWNAGTTYGLAERVLDDTNHRIYESLVGTNLNHPLSDPAYWLDIGPSNAWAMFDTYNATQTVHPYTIDVSLSLAGRVDSLALLNLSNAVSARIIITTALDGLVFDRTFSLISTAGISDWYTYLFEDVTRMDTLFVNDLPTYLDPTIRIILEGDGTQVGCGICIVGLTKNLGKTLHDGAQVGITDYSRKEADEFGNYLIVQRPFAKRGSFQMRIDKSAVDGVQATLAEYRAVPAVYLATNEYTSTMFFGFFREFNIEIDRPTQSLVSIEIEGLT